MVMDRASITTSASSAGHRADCRKRSTGFSRKDVDEFALRSQKRATSLGRKDGSRSPWCPVKDVSGMVVLDNDEFIRSDATLEGLGGLKPHSSRWARWASTPPRCAIHHGRKN